MHIKRICYPVTTLGPGRRVSIWVTGCNRKCPGCMSEELWDIESGKDMSIDQIMLCISKINHPIDGFTISGGEPFLQREELSELVFRICNAYTDDIIIYTGFTIEELKGLESTFVQDVLENISVLIDGEYIDNLNDGKGIRGSSNQRINVFKYASRYARLDSEKRRVQSFRYGNKILVVGIQ